jgi:protein TonB
MPTPSPAARRPSSRLTAWRPSRRAAWWILAAVALGFGLFALIWFDDRNKDEFYRVGDTPPTAAAPAYRPLPAPLPAGARDRSGLDTAPSDTPTDRSAGEGGLPRLVETAPPPAPPVPAQAEAPEPPSGALVQPRPIHMPPPDYPRRALRRGDRGIVRVRAYIGPDGVPTSVEVAQGSGSRDLDRAAVDAVERWRFQPATQGGVPTVGTVVVPISFEPRR